MDKYRLVNSVADSAIGVAKNENMTAAPNMADTTAIAMADIVRAIDRFIDERRMAAAILEEA
jgi:hypothetical protein